MSDRILNILFLCTGNSARSILAESALNKLGEGRFRAFSAGSFPKDAVNPDAIALLERIEYQHDCEPSQRSIIVRAGGRTR